MLSNWRIAFLTLCYPRGYISSHLSNIDGTTSTIRNIHENLLSFLNNDFIFCNFQQNLIEHVRGVQNVIILKMPICIIFPKKRKCLRTAFMTSSSVPPPPHVHPPPSFEFCRKMQKVESLFTKFNQFSRILRKKKSIMLKTKWNITDYNGL